MNILFEIVLVLILLAAMVLVLLGISRLSFNAEYDNEAETKEIKREISESVEVFSENNAFHKLIDKNINSDSSKYKIK